MRISYLLRVAALGSALSLTGSPIVAMADDKDCWSPDWGRMMEMWGPGGMMGGYGGQWMLDRVDGRLAYMKTEINVRDDQEAAWTAFSVAVRSTVEAHNTLMQDAAGIRDGDQQSMSLTDRLAWQEARLEARLVQVRALKDATEKFYTVLDEQQKEAADDVVLPMMGMGSGRQGRHMLRQ